MKYLGAFLGGLVASIPWVVLDYVGFVWALLAIPIAIGVEKGYRIAGGKNSSELPKVVAGMTILIVVILSLYIMPLIYIILELGMFATPLDLYYFYMDGNWGSVIPHLLISILFAALGISGVVKNLKNQTNNENNIEDKTELVAE